MSSDQIVYSRAALQRVLRPLSRLLIRFGIRFDEFAAIAKATYVESAVRDCEHPTFPSRGRIAALTGLTLRQVDRCIDDGADIPAVDETLRALLVEVLHKWHTVPEYGGPYGIPLELEFSTPRDRCFCSLVALVDATANPNLVLGELLRSGAVLRAGEKRFRPMSRFFMMPDPTSPRLIERFGMTLGRLGATLEYNTDPKHPDKRMERRVSADRGLPEHLLPKFETFARGKAADFLMELDNWLAAQTEPESGSGDGADRADTGVNVFLYVDPPAAATEAPLRSLVSPS